MPRRITETCVACGTCQANCPVGCITEGEIYTIDSASCIDCGVCEAGCPVSAIEEE